MNDPYKVLGVSENATDDEIKAAYRELAKKYHPDNYVNNPLSDLALEKMKEINEAYDQVQKMRAGGGGSGGYASDDFGGFNGGSGGGSAQYRNVRELISAGRIAEAQSILDAVKLRDRDAEWHFLMGSVMYRKGWTSEAYVNFQSAYRAEPGNPEYRSAVERMSRQANGGGFYGGGYGGFGGYNGGEPGGCNGCDLCSALMCANCLCNGGQC